MTPSETSKSLLVIHGPNLNMLGKREPEIYGTATLADIDTDLKEKGARLGLAVDTFQSNHEGALVEKIQSAVGTVDGIIINPAAYTHTSVALRDAVLLIDAPVVEIHLSNIYKRETFRHTSMLAGVVTGQISGLGVMGYTLALEAIATMITEVE
jgi:3-dehydroquinate dehydratase-2